MDIGSTSTRMGLYTESGRDITIQCPEKSRGKFEAGDFSSSCYLWDNKKPYYIGNKLDKTRIATSIKPFILLLSEADPGTVESLISEYPDGEKLLEERDDKSPRDRNNKTSRGRNSNTFMTRMENTLKDFFASLRQYIVKACDDEKLHVTAVGFAIPGQWPLEVQDFLTDFALRTLLKEPSHISVTGDDIWYPSETQALGHYLFKHRAKALKMPKSNSSTYLLADFGGQNLVSPIAR